MQIIKLHTTDSTNSALQVTVRQRSLADGTVIWAQHQMKGRGQTGRSWCSEPGKSLTFSMLKRFKNFKIEDLSFFNMQIASGLGAFLQRFSSQEIQCKWPNDILSDGKKISGILIENSIQSNRIKYSIIGIGINLFPLENALLPYAGALFNNEVNAFNTEVFLEELVNTLFSDLKDFENADKGLIKENYLKRLFGFNCFKKYKITTSGEIINAQITDVNQFGQLVLQSESGKVYTFENRAVELIN